MPVSLDKPFRWTRAKADEAAMLDDLQGNILKGHGREHTVNLFLKFTAAKDGRRFVKRLAARVVSAHAQLKNAEEFKRTGKSAGPFVSVLLSAQGYGALGIEKKRIPPNEDFRQGLKARSASLRDPAVAAWEAPFQSELHALVLVAGETAEEAAGAEAAVRALFTAGVVVAAVERGLAMRNANGNGIEHFGYVDGRSQPMVLMEDVERERERTDGIAVWNPALPLRQLLVRCPGGGSKNSFGSYFVFRKLEQNVKGFREKEAALAAHLGLAGEAAELAGAFAVGRFEDGTPVVMQNRDGVHHPVPNNFDFRDDPEGRKCPFHAHIRKMNPRGESGQSDEREHLIFRRGIPYGVRRFENGTFADLPTGGVGLLFMCCQASIKDQFETMQKRWANDPAFVKENTGLDPLIGQGTAAPQNWPVQWGSSEKRPFAFEPFVKMLGGEYFFAPSISFLKGLEG